MTRFKRIERDGQRALVREEWPGPIAAALIDREGCTPAGKGGRGGVLRFTYPGGMGIIRRYRRGGAVRRVFRDAYVLANRPFRELRILRRLCDRGLPAPEPLGACWSRSGLLYRGAIATREVPGVPLDAFLAVAIENGTASADMAGRLREVGQAIRSVHDAGVFHADLQTGNILVGPEEVHVIDFDKARMVSSLSPLARARNLLRLRRSMDKNGLPPDLFHFIREGYGEVRLPKWLQRLYDLKGRASDALAGRNRKDSTTDVR